MHPQSDVRPGCGRDDSTDSLYPARMSNRMSLVLGAVSGVVAALVVAAAVVMAWPGVTPTVPGAPTAVILPTPSPTPLPVITAAPSATISIAGPSTSIAPFGDQ
jgi:hypothetical protein